MNSVQSIEHFFRSRKNRMEFPNGSSLNWESDSTFYHELVRRDWLNAIGRGIGRSMEYESEQSVESMMSAQGLAGETTAMDRPRGEVSVEKEVELDIKRLEQQLAVKKRMQVLLLAHPEIAEFMNLSRGILK